jgi:hypothetical protein
VFTWPQVLAMRLGRSFLDEPAEALDPAGVVSAVGGLQAQVTAAAEMGLAMRSAGVTRDAVRRELWEQKTLVRTYAHRQTIHLLPAAELPLWMAAVRAATHWRELSWYEVHKLDSTSTDALLDAFRDALDGRILTREELAREVAHRAGEWARQRIASQWADLIDTACYAGVVCYAPGEGGKVRFARPDQWLGAWDKPDPHASLLQVFRRYLAAYGPARPRDFAVWISARSMKSADLAPLIATLGDEIEEVAVEGKRALMFSADASSPPEPIGPIVNLLPQYDCYLLGCRFGREYVAPPTLHALVTSLGKPFYEGPVQHQLLLIDGVVAGIWERSAKTSEPVIRVFPLRTLRQEERAGIEVQAGRIGALYEVEVKAQIVEL